ncbi:MAG TPA: D-aminoacyl-tRNA deacylase [Actinomycetota bacterium]|nr:D-aminoacyl-tRNA deacylase [Actinomycetota bacterium]
MRLVVQRVSRAAVRVGERTVARTGLGLLVLVGVGRDDPPGEEAWLARKLYHLRVFEDEEGKMNRSLAEVGGEVLLVPNFTLYGDVRRGRRPSWERAAPPEVAEERVEALARALEALGARVARGAFGEHMEVELVNDGPVTLLLEPPR